jgi:phosphatidate cytidylyltransferase
MRDLAGRVLIAVPLLVAVLAAAYFGGWWLFAVAAVAGVLALHELYSMLRPLRPLVLAGFAGLLAGVLGAELGGAEWLFAGLLATFVIAFGLYGIAETRQSGTVAMATTILGAFWIGAGIGHLVLLRDIGGDEYLGRLSIFTVLLAVWAGDTAAYFAGRLVGRHRLAAVLSPGKTWEGFVAGSIVSVLVAFFALYQDRDQFLAIWQALVLGAVIAVVGTIGDLFESAVKRDMGVKDSGRLLGGHGGVLDRIDALLFASVAGYYTIVALH